VRSKRSRHTERCRPKSHFWAFHHTIGAFDRALAPDPLPALFRSAACQGLANVVDLSQISNHIGRFDLVFSQEIELDGDPVPWPQLFEDPQIWPAFGWISLASVVSGQCIAERLHRIASLVYGMSSPRRRSQCRGDRSSAVPGGQRRGGRIDRPVKGRGGVLDLSAAAEAVLPTPTPLEQGT
jgi:hypothetical protein